MALYLIENKQIVGTTNDPAAKLPKELYVVEGMDTTSGKSPSEELYYNGAIILRKPPKPSSTGSYVWDSETNSWQEQVDVFSLAELDLQLPDWYNLSKTLQDSPVWLKVKAAGLKTNAANFAITILLRVMDVTRNEEELLVAFNDLREVMKAASALEDFNTSELQFIQASLTKNKFTITV